VDREGRRVEFDKGACQAHEQTFQSSEPRVFFGATPVSAQEHHLGGRARP